jgi:hypothetical protein
MIHRMPSRSSLTGEASERRTKKNERKIMGHANLANLSKVFAKHLYAKGTVTIVQVVDHCVKIGEGLQASEGEYGGEEGRYMIATGLETIIGYLLKQATPVVVAVDMTPEQTKIYNTWVDGSDNSLMDWDCGDDGFGGEYGILDSIQWRFAPGWRKRYPNIPVLGNITT